MTTKAKGLWVGPPEAAHGTDPSTSGALYSWVPILNESLSELRDMKTPIPTQYDTGRNHNTAPIEGPDGWEFSCEVPLNGLTLAAGDGVDASTVADTYVDTFSTHIFGSRYTTVGTTLTAVPDADGFQVAAGDPYDRQDLVVAYESGVPARERAQWSFVDGDNGAQDYDVAPSWADFGTAPLTAAAILYGIKGYLPTFDGGATLPFVYRRRGQDYTLLGGRCTSAVITIEPGKIIRLALTFRGDTKTPESKASLPLPSRGPALTPLRGLRSPFWFAGTRYATRRVTIDLGVTAGVVEATEGPEGRGDDLSVSMLPKVTIEPLFSTALESLKRLATPGPLLVQMGAGILNGGALNVGAFHASEAVALTADPVDDNGRRRQSVEFEITDPVQVGGVAARVFQLAFA